MASETTSTGRGDGTTVALDLLLKDLEACVALWCRQLGWEQDGGSKKVREDDILAPAAEMLMVDWCNSVCGDSWGSKKWLGFAIVSKGLHLLAVLRGNFWLCGMVPVIMTSCCLCGCVEQIQFLKTYVLLALLKWRHYGKDEVLKLWVLCYDLDCGLHASRAWRSRS